MRSYKPITTIMAIEILILTNFLGLVERVVGCNSSQFKGFLCTWSHPVLFVNLSACVCHDIFVKCVAEEIIPSMWHGTAPGIFISTTVLLD